MSTTVPLPLLPTRTAERSAKVDLALRAIATTENIEVDDDDIEEELSLRCLLCKEFKIRILKYCLYKHIFM